MVLGDTCTRGCRFCAVRTSRHGRPVDPAEPAKLATAIAEMELDYVVITSVDRDDLSDQGADHFAACIRAIHARCPDTLVEALIPDFRGDTALLGRVLDARPDVLAQNLETVERLTHPVRDPRAGYRTTLEVLAAMKDIRPSQWTKSSLMVGLGETVDEMSAAMADLRAAGVDFLTVGQYLQPTPKHLPVVEFVTPDQFSAYEAMGREMGFAYVASGPLVRSSYRAGEFYLRRLVSAEAK
jgi:lipoic acid synthetase